MHGVDAAPFLFLIRPFRLPLSLTASVLPEKGVPSAVVGTSVGDVRIAQLDWTV